MKKALLVLSALLFVGAGCASTAPATPAPAVTPTTVKTTTVAPSAAKTAPAPADVKTSVQIVPSTTEKTTK